MEKSISYSERWFLPGRYLDGRYPWIPDHRFPGMGRGGWDRAQIWVWVEWSWTGESGCRGRGQGLRAPLYWAKSTGNPPGMQGIIKSKTVALSTPPGVGQIAQMPGEQDTLSLARGDLQASGHSWQQRSLCLFLSPLALGVTAANEGTNVHPFRDCLGAWN